MNLQRRERADTGSRDAALTSFTRSRAFDTLRLESPEGSSKRVCDMPSALAFRFIVRTNAAMPPG